jgi:hypothetical protein
MELLSNVKIPEAADIFRKYSLENSHRKQKLPLLKRGSLNLSGELLNETV